MSSKTDSPALFLFAAVAWVFSVGVLLLIWAGLERSMAGGEVAAAREEAIHMK